MRRALVTGASGAIGRAIAERLAAEGHFVYLHGHRNRAALEETVAAIQGRHGSGRCKAITFDVTDPQAAAEGVSEILGEGPIEIVVSNAGRYADAPMAGMDAEQWRSPIEISLNGFHHVVQPLLLPMARQRWGRIIAVSSVSGVLGNRGQANYAAAKAGLHGAIKSLAKEMGSRGITANAVAPGVIESEATREQFSAEHVDSLVPAGRMGSPGEVASLVGFLASEPAGYINGQVIGIDGGLT
ncbi:MULTISPECIES: 3-oxoacyl-ACP reductase FabG [unclassified Halorhodospira]|uniref:3-oxoacyl-ACP reductase FabG n=1 Tax=unclassified Halorhodospira TaxID=2626748 RepID=UPI001EE99BCC|nr:MULTISPECIES: 3-oxoacyl-ACP reductase FabG [unclassified Halorhodospira]MCG5540231.1 3-oxoacyl-ACP reductase FabG [Halorhodospira sp. M39old]MCG5545068.1 3-oxoacyl-ACP reductase FabG [Halorhodospira sp. M38]